MASIANRKMMTRPGRDHTLRVPVETVPAAMAAGLVAILLMWWHDGPELGNPGDVITTLGDVCGLLVGYGVVVQVALMARLPPLERGVGADRLARWHGRNGRWVVCILVAHALLIIWGYAVSANAPVTSEAWSVVSTQPDVLMATAAMFLLVGIGIVSLRAARRRLRYETWYYLHFYTYLAIALAFSHQFAVGPDFAPLANRIGWSALYATVGALLLWYRVLAPVRLSLRHRLRVAGVRREAPDVVSVILSGRRLADLGVEPGQFFRWRFLTRNLWWSSHPYSVSGLPRQDLLRITVKDRGDHSGSLGWLRPGTRVIAEGPYGALTAAAGRRRRKILLLAGGVGITPLRTMFEKLPGQVTLVYRASGPRDVVFRRELDAVAQARSGTVRYLLGSRAELGWDPISAGHLRELVPGLHRHEVYVCGPPGMTETAIAALQQAGVPRKRMHREAFDF